MKQTGMFNFGEAARQTLTEDSNSLSAAIACAPMTLSEKVHSLFEQLHIPVFRYVMRKTRDSGQAEDITQETFLRLFRQLGKDPSLENPKAWLFTVASNLAVDAGRGNSHLQDLDEAAWAKMEDTRVGSGTDPEKLTMQRERTERLGAAVMNLTVLQRDCLHLRSEGLRYREIAELMDISISTVVDAVRRATLNLARQFEDGVSL